MIDQRKNIIKLFDQLIEKGEEIRKELKRQYFSGNRKSIKTEMYESWKTSCLTLLKSTFSSSSPHYDKFANLKIFDYYNATQIYLGILKAAREDIEKGYFYHKDLMLSVNIFDSLLSRSYDYIQDGEIQKALGVLEAVILEVMSKILEYKKVRIEKDWKIEQLSKKLLDKEVIDSMTYERLIEMAGKLQNNIDEETISSDIKWVQSFIYNFLGSKILIIN